MSSLSVSERGFNTKRMRITIARVLFVFRAVSRRLLERLDSLSKSRCTSSFISRVCTLCTLDLQLICSLGSQSALLLGNSARTASHTLCRCTLRNSHSGWPQHEWTRTFRDTHCLCHSLTCTKGAGSCRWKWLAKSHTNWAEGVKHSTLSWL